MNYLTSSKLFTDYVHINEKLNTRVVSFLLHMYPECIPNFMTQMNLEEIILFQAKVVRLEDGREIHNKCFKNIYPREWIYHFDDKCGGHEFLRRYWMIVNHMRDKYFAKIEDFDFVNLYQACTELMEFCQEQMVLKKNPENDSNAIFPLHLASHEKDELLLKTVEQTIKEISSSFKDGGLFLSYLFGFIAKEEFLYQCEHRIDFYRYQVREGNREYSFFDPKKAMRKMDYLPLVLTYLVMVKEGLTEDILRYPPDKEDKTLIYLQKLSQ